MKVVQIAGKNHVVQTLTIDDFGSIVQVGCKSAVLSFPSKVAFDAIVSLDTVEHTLRELSDE